MNNWTLFAELEKFFRGHRACGELTYWTSPPTPEGYRIRVACPCGTVFDRRVTLDAAQEDLLRSGILAFSN